MSPFKSAAGSVLSTESPSAYGKKSFNKGKTFLKVLMYIYNFKIYLHGPWWLMEAWGGPVSCSAEEEKRKKEKFNITFSHKYIL